MTRPLGFFPFTALMALLSAASAQAAEPAACPGNPDAIGVSRVMTVDAAAHARLGLMHYRDSLPLIDREVVLTFDDGPLPPYTDRVLTILAHHCVKATFFLVGRHAAANPAAALRVAEAGHTIGNHSQNHYLHFDQISEPHAEREIESGRRTLDKILGQHVAPFFRIPGLGRTHAVERYAQARSLSVWSADAVADDWTRITSDQVMKRALARLEARGKGILLLHDIQPRTVLMLPALLAELKRRHFRIVHVVPAGAARPAPPPVSVLVAKRIAPKLGWPRIASMDPPVHLPADAPASSAALRLPALPEPPDLRAAQASPIEELARATAIRALRLAGGAPPEAAMPSLLRVAAAAPHGIGPVPLPPRKSQTAHHGARRHAPETAVAAVTMFRPEIIP